MPGDAQLPTIPAGLTDRVLVPHGPGGGYAATTMTAIADHAGVAERTVHNLFARRPV